VILPETEVPPNLRKVALLVDGQQKGGDLVAISAQLSCVN